MDVADCLSGKTGMLYDIVQVRSDCKVPFRKKMDVMMLVVITKHTQEMTIGDHGSRSGRCGQKVARFKPCAEPHVRAGEENVVCPSG